MAVPAALLAEELNGQSNLLLNSFSKEKKKKILLYKFCNFYKYFNHFVSLVVGGIHCVLFVLKRLQQNPKKLIIVSNNLNLFFEFVKCINRSLNWEYARHSATDDTINKVILYEKKKKETKWKLLSKMFRVWIFIFT